ncbi:MAG: RNA polymerase sigma factor [Actinomycetota bacterium]|jgi:RNA polymerase sigma factor (sigma-70 family)|nr:RNA polymerase sigma factor [Actinomycetota bacterium]
MRRRGPAGDDRDLFAELYPRLRRFAHVLARQDADDLVQEALTRTLAVRSLASIEDPLAYLRTAMVRIQHNHERAAKRHKQRRIRIGPVEDSSRDRYPSDLADLMRVPARARAVLFLTVVEEESYRDAAEIVGCSQAAARQMASRAMRELRRDIEDELHTGDLP